MRAVGLTHLTAVSGANLAIVSGAVLVLATAARAPRPVSLAAAGCSVAAFVVLARPEPSVLRAALMGGIALVGLARGRRGRGVSALAATTTGLLVVDPWLIRSFGFVLSVLATGGLLLLARPLSDRIPGPRPLALALAVPLAAQLACAPVQVLLQPAVSPVAVPANLLAAPAVPPATLCGVLAAALAPFQPWAAHLAARVGGFATSWIAGVAHRAAELPWATVPWPEGVRGALALALAVVAVLGLLLAAPPRRAGTTRQGDHGPGAPGAGRGARAPATVLPALVLLALVTGWLVSPALPRPDGRWPPPGWAVALCDVGQGTALAVRTGPGRAALVDVGPDPRRVTRCLRGLRVRALDLVALTTSTPTTSAAPGRSAGAARRPCSSPLPGAGDRFRRRQTAGRATPHPGDRGALRAARGRRRRRPAGHLGGAVATGVLVAGRAIPARGPALLLPGNHRPGRRPGEHRRRDGTRGRRERRRARAEVRGDGARCRHDPAGPGRSRTRRTGRPGGDHGGGAAGRRRRRGAPRVRPAASAALSARPAAGRAGARRAGQRLRPSRPLGAPDAVGPRLRDRPHRCPRGRRGRGPGRCARGRGSWRDRCTGPVAVSPRCTGPVAVSPRGAGASPARGRVAACHPPADDRPPAERRRGPAPRRPPGRPCPWTR